MVAGVPDPIIAAGIHAAGEAINQAADAVRNDADAIRIAAKESGSLEKAAEFYGKRMAVRQALILRLWEPVALMIGFSRDYFQEAFPRELAQKLEGVPDGDIQAPKTSIAAPVMQALGFSLDEPPLKEMYLNLLAGASTKSHADLVHPSFVEAVRQLSSAEVPILNLVLQGRQAAVRLKRVLPGGKGYSVIRSHVVPLAVDGIPFTDSKLEGWVENWDRLGLVKVDYTQFILVDGDDSAAYSWVENWPIKIEAEAALPVTPEGQPPYSISFDKGLVQATARGRDFYRAVGSPPTSPPIL